ncbi:MAG: ABC transporter permease subunit [Planctomycetota bacterium]
MSASHAITADDAARLARVAELRRRRPVNRYLRVSLVLCGVLGVVAWIAGDLFPRFLFDEASRRNVARFLGELRPEPLQGEPWDWGVFAQWVRETLVHTRGLGDAWRTFNLAVLAIVLAGTFAALVAPLGARTLATRDPLSDAPDTAGWRWLRRVVRLGFVLLRALPEYVLAFLLMAMLPSSAWPAVLALAMHNAGILGRLHSETLENLPAGPLRSLRQAGATRAQLAFAAGFPLALGRLLLYVFYRYETCVREATVLGILGIRTLGYSIQDARSKLYYDEMLLLILLSVVLVLAADAASVFVRRWLRRA